LRSENGIILTSFSRIIHPDYTISLRTIHIVRSHINVNFTLVLGLVQAKPRIQLATWEPT